MDGFKPASIKDQLFLIRLIDLKTRQVTTTAGTGAKGLHLHGEADALGIALNSPWDLTKIGDDLYIAMAGAHQIWKLRLNTGKLELVAGNGREDVYVVGDVHDWL